MPVRNAGGYLRPAVDSILQQQDVELELIVVDDHSTDQALSTLPKDTRVKIVHTPDKGLVPALNHGLKHASGFWLARMDGDDIALPHRLRTQKQFLLDHPEISVCGTQVRIFRDQDEVQQGYQHYQGWINSLCSPTEIHNALFIESPIPHPSAFLRRQTLIELGGYQDRGWPEDYDLWCRAQARGLRFGKPQGILLMWRDYPNRTSRQDPRYHKHRFLDCKAFYLSAYLKTRGHRRVTVWGCGPTGLKLHDLLAKQGVYTDAFVDINPKLRGCTKREKPVHVVNQPLCTHDVKDIKSISLIAVSTRGAREKILAELQKVNWAAGEHYLCVA